MTLREAWDARADEWARYVRAPGSDRHNWELILPAFLESVPPSGRATLDVGCGEGRVGRELAARGHRVVGVDSSARMVEYARESQEAVVADAAALPFDDAAFDLVTAYMSLMDMDDMPAAVAEAARVLESGGRFCFCVSHPILDAGAFENGAFVIAGSYFESRIRVERIEGFEFHWRTFPLEAYGRALERAGLLVELLREPVALHRIPLVLVVRAVKP